MSPRDAGLPNGDETITQTTRQYVDEQTAQIGVNTSFYRLENGLEARPTNNNGIAASDGDRYSPWDSTGQVGFNITQGNLAQMLGASREAVNKQLRALAKDGRIVMDGPHIKVARSTKA